MKKRTIMRCLAIMLLSISTSPILAQKNINKLVEELEKRDNIKVSLVTNRNPQTRGITNQIKTFSATDENMLNELVKAFEKDEEYTRTAMKEAKKTNGIHVVEYTYIFTSEEGNYNYSLESSSKTKGKFELTIIFNPSRKKKEKE
ncbi:MAG: DUF5024 domain-containing protein [Bacteroides sp.]|nr:DUF5024 domain-containing protein [Bacteroides sp.]